MAKKVKVKVSTKQIEKDLRKAGMKPNKEGLRKLAAEAEKKLNK